MSYPHDPSVQPGKWLGLAIATTMFCCTPLGIVGIVYAGMAMSAQSRGDFFTAEVQTGKAKMWTAWSFGVGLVALIVLLCLNLNESAGTY